MSDRRSPAPRTSRRRGIALEAALRGGGLTHAYLFHGPPGTRQARGRAGVRGGADLPRAPPIAADAERRVLSGVHPDLAWVEPRGAHDILVDDVRDADRAAGRAAPVRGASAACS